ncbi:MAG: 23S rRNA (uracil(1939)-C(5))-methyltransferase RlmD, partial [Sinomicrobium sp.]|nr:23S rRNA (uracil(1939)-C(5))-methyltransferase RlmD [Sinomicrobium sp.]
IPGKWDKILDIKACHLQQDPSNAIRLAVKDFALRHGMPFFNPHSQSGLLRSLMIRIASTGEVMAVLQFAEDDPENRTLLLNHLSATFPGITSLQYVINRKKNDTIYDLEVVCFSGRDHIVEKIEELHFKIGAKSFYQTNSRQAQVLYGTVRDFAGLRGNERVYDLYSGAGTIALFLAGTARKVTGIEAVPEAVVDARANAALNRITNVDFFAGDMKHLLNEAFIRANGRPDVIVTDPPRDGMHSDVIRQLLKAAPQKIVYVSCNSATQARDLALLDEQYTVSRVQPVDMFPQTHHVENVVLLEKRSGGSV